MKKIRLCFAVLFALIMLNSCSYRAEMQAVQNIQEITDRVYFMDYKGNYNFDEYLASGGSTNVEELSAFLMNSLKKGKWTLSKNKTVSNIQISDFACCSITVKDSENNGAAIFGRNYDWKDCAVLIIHTNSDNGYESISTCCLSHLGLDDNWKPSKKFLKDIIALGAIYIPMDGMNEKGLYIADLMAGDAETTSQNRGNLNLTTTDAIRLVLDKAANVDQAISILDSIDMHSVIGWAYHFAIADATGKAVCVEWVDNKMYVSETKILTNHYVTDCPKKDDGKNPETENSNVRFNILKERGNAANWTMNAEEVKDALKAASAGQFKGKAITVWSAVFEPESRKVTYCFRENYDKNISVQF